MHKKLSTPFAIAIIIAFAGFVGSMTLIWSNYYTYDIGTTFPAVHKKIPKNNNTNNLIGGDRDEHGCIPSAGYEWCEEKQKCLRSWEESCSSLNNAVINWSKIQFDACGKKESYQNQPWWNNFAQKVSEVNYFSDNELLTGIRNDDTYGNYNNLNEYCKDPNNSKKYICTNGNQKLSINNFNEYSEGCLSKDNTVFIVVFTGEYSGDGNHVFRYDIKNNILEEAKKINEKEGEAWFNPPTQFLKRNGTIVGMYGFSGDAGASVKSWYDYNFVINEVKIIKDCNTSDNSNGQPVTTCTIVK